MLRGKGRRKRDTTPRLARAQSLQAACAAVGPVCPGPALEDESPRRGSNPAEDRQGEQNKESTMELQHAPARLERAACR
jgi:hypothetical protein